MRWLIDLHEIEVHGTTRDDLPSGRNTNGVFRGTQKIHLLSKQERIGEGRVGSLLADKPSPHHTTTTTCGGYPDPLQLNPGQGAVGVAMWGVGYMIHGISKWMRCKM